MAERESMRGHPSECDPAGSEETLDLYLKLADECMRTVGKMPPRKFNNEQCEYLAHKLEVVLKCASSFLKELGSAEHPRSRSSADMARFLSIFKLLLALAKEIESFIQSCCKDAWIQAAMTLTNVSEYVSSVGFKLELCRIALCAATGSLTVDQVDDINKAEVEFVEKKASVDADSLLEKVILELNTLRGEMRDLANYLLERMKGVKPIPASHLSSSESDIGDGSFFRRLYKRVFEKVQQTTLLGRGASANVHKATWLGTQVAKKTFLGRENPYFVKEANILAGLCHPNITSMFCCAMDKRTCSIIMELMDEDLHNLMHNLMHARCDGESDNPPFFILEAVGIMLQVGEGMKYLHDHKIMHGDLKSMNILVRSVQGRELEIGYVHAKVADFGLSKTKECSTRFSSQTFNTGSTRWMPPEVINLDNLTSQVSISKDLMGPKYPFKRDVYSFGMVCYEVLTGNQPFPDESSLKNVKKKVLKGERPDLPDYCPKELKALIKRCWSQVPKERPTFVNICQELKYLNFLLLRGLNHGPHRTIEEPLQQIPSTSQEHSELANNMHLQGPNMLHHQVAERKQVGASEVRSESSSHGVNGHASAGVEISDASIDPSYAGVIGSPNSLGASDRVINRPSISFKRVSLKVMTPGRRRAGTFEEIGKEKAAMSKGVSNSRKSGEKSVQSRVNRSSMENIMYYEDPPGQPSVVFFQEVVQEKRYCLRRFVAALIKYDKHRCDSKLEQNGCSLRDVVHRLFPHAKFAKEKHFRYGIEAWVSCKAFKEFGKSEEKGPPGRRRQIESMEEYRELTIVIEAEKAIMPEGEDYIRSFHLFCNKQFGYILNELKWKEKWPDHLLKDFLEAMKHVWRVHKFALAFEPAVSQFIAKPSAQCDVKLMEPLELPTVLQTDSLSPFTRQVGLLVNPGFIVLDRIIKCQVYLAPDMSLV